MGKKFFIACTHFNHTNIIKYCQRPFQSTEEMNETMIKNWNDKVTNEDEIYVLGDFALNCTPEWACELVDKLNGKKYFIRGNHDEKLLKGKNFFYKFTWVRKLHFLYENGTIILLTHIEKPNLKIDRSIPYRYHFYSHDHAKIPTKLKSNSLYNVGVDANNFAPVELNEIFNVLKSTK